MNGKHIKTDTKKDRIETKKRIQELIKRNEELPSLLKPMYY